MNNKIATGKVCVLNSWFGPMSPLSGCANMFGPVCRGFAAIGNCGPARPGQRIEV
jgi:hypothetical protein